MKKICFVLCLIMALSLCACNNVQNLENKEKNQIQIEQNKLDESQGEQQEEISKEENNIIEKTEEPKLENDVELNQNAESGNEEITVTADPLSNTKCAWGFVRKKDEVRPEFSAKYTKPLDDYDGIYAGNPDEKIMYLTFDEGYENGYTASILDTLKEKEVSATFFVTMPYVKQNPDLIRRMIDEGHIVR